MTPLSAPLPLRTTAVWPGYREPVAIPHRYGQTGGLLLQYSADRRVFAWADHACAGVDEVLIGGQPVGNWQHRNAPDSTGRAVCFVEFDQPVEEGATPIARGRGKLGAAGLPMTNPADVVIDILAGIAGRPLIAAQLADFRAECASAGLEVGGSIERPDSVRAVVRQLCSSVGAVFAEDAQAVCHLWPGPVGGVAAVVGRQHELQASVRLSDVATEATLRYAWEDGGPRAQVQAEATESVQMYGRRSRQIDAPWIASGRVAVAVLTRLLQHSARPAWGVLVGPLERPLRIGQTVRLDHPVLPLASLNLVLGREFDVQAETTVVRLSLPVGDLPAVRVISQSSQLAAALYEGVSITTVGDERVLTLREADGRPIVGAAARLDDNITRFTDGAGRVSFPVRSMPPGVHVIQVLTADGRSLATEVTV
jgi:hypothetical protein